MKIYNFLVFVISVGIITILEATNSFGISEIESCYIKKDSIGEKIDFCLSFAFVALLTLSYFMIKKQLGCCLSPAFYQLSKVILSVIITAFISKTIEIVLYFQRKAHISVSNSTVLTGSIFSILFGVSVSIVRLGHPKIIAKLKGDTKNKEGFKEAFINDHEKESVLKNILKMTVDTDSDDLADMFDRLGHKTLIQILVLLTLKFSKEKSLALSLSEAVSRYRSTKDHKFYEFSSYSSLANKLNLPFIENVYCPGVSLIEFEAGIFHCISKSAGFEKSTILE